MSLPSDRAFLVQFGDGQLPAGVVRGRVEHLVSGSVARFDGWDQLRSFVEVRVRSARRRARA